MSLQGTLETIPLSDVLSLLAATGKSGELRVTGARGDGRLWLDGGKVVGSEVPGATTPTDSVFELLRLTSGTFNFDAGVVAPDPGDPVAVDALLGEARERLSAWKAIEAVVPSTSCRVGLAAELSSESVTVSRRQWHDLVAVAQAGDVEGVMQRLGLGEFEASRTVKELVDAGLVKVAPASARREPAAPVRRDGAPPAPPAARAPEGPAPTTAPPKAPAASPPVAVTARRASPAGPPAAEPATADAAPPRRGPAAVASNRTAVPPAQASPPSREEAEELVHQLAALGEGSVAPTAPARAAKGDPAAGEDEGTGEGAGATVGGNGRAAKPSGSTAEEEPINRGMLLKFLSSVRP